MEESAEKKRRLTEPRRMLLSNYFLENGTIVTPLLLFYLDLVVNCGNIYRFVQYIPMGRFNNFVQSAVNAGRVGEENPNPSVVAEKLKLLANSSYSYQIRDRTRHAVTKYLSDQKAHDAINNKMFKILGFINDQINEEELVMSEIEHKEPTIVGFLFLQYAKLRMLELYNNFFDKYCDVIKSEEV